ncbi:RHS repeat-associated core domain-containing protein [Aliiglaciecola sp. M165]|uniref:RHS repeat-associated core domain-containing protein n=1 Tax=Aliiglaciecola sp. M165 TaxID=2593649 RepID=UPI00117CBDB0|nr:RHS repeat-associated core domain-containing protein [Aliiglaciecola sp. M165]TRY30325.1 hypothetical protein FM019_16060 [Aliiglaciecola sp. M165]
MRNSFYTIFLLLFSFSVNSTVCDIDHDGDIDFLDIRSIVDDLVTNSGRVTEGVFPGDLRDADFDGIITTADVNICIDLCTVPNSLCASPSAVSPPEFAGDTALIGFEGQTFIYPLQINSDSPYTLELLSAPDGMVLDTTTETIIWDDVIEGQFSFEIKASVSETVFTSQIFQLNIIDGEPSHEGSDFWLGFGSNANNYTDGHLFLYVSSQTDTQGLVDIPLLGLSFPFSVSAGVTEKIELPVDLRTDSNSPARIISDKGIHVTTDDNVVLYALNQLEFSTDGFLVFPTETLGNDYRVMSYDGGQVYFVATQDNTTVDFTFSETVKLLRDGNLGNTTIFTEGQIFTEVLNAGQIYTLEANLFVDNTITGSKIVSDKPIAAFSGNQCINVPSGKSACDHLVEQLPASHYWGTTYYTVPLAERFGGDIIRIVADFDNTHVVVNGELIGVLDAGEWIEDSISESSIIKASHPVLVAQLSKGASVDFAENEMLGDPAMILLSPVEQYVSRYQFTTTDLRIDFNYVNLIATMDVIGAMTIDGISVDASLFTTINGTDYLGAQLLVSEGSHTIESNEPFGASIYGFGAFDSYGYQGGIRLPRYTEQANLTLVENPAEGIKGQEACFDIRLSNGNLPIVNGRVDVFTQNAAQEIYHYFANELGVITHCHVGLEAIAETLTFKSQALEIQAVVQWQTDNAGTSFEPVIVSNPVTTAKVGDSYLYDVLAIDSNEGDVLLLELLDGPSGMVVNGQELTWQPTELDVGVHNVELSISDQSGLSSTQTFEISVVIGNQNPTFETRFDNYLVFTGRFYQNFITPSDPDGDVVYCEMLDNPLYGPKNNTNIPQTCNTILTFLASEDDIGVYPVTVRFYDRTGGETFETFTIEVRKNNRPELIANPAPFAKVGTPYSYQIEVQDIDGDELSYAVSVFIAGTNSPTSLKDLAIDPQTGVVTFTPTADQVGEYDIHVFVTDAATDVNSRFIYTVKISAQDQPVSAQLEITPQFAAPGEEITIKSSLFGASGFIDYALTIDGIPLVVDDNGEATLNAPNDVGIYPVSLTATDDIGQVALVESYLSVKDGSDTVPPVARIDSPVSSDIVSALTQVRLTAQDDDLVEWGLYLLSVSDIESPTLLVSGQTPLNNAVAYEFDPSMLTNGLYKLQLNVTDASGLISSDTIDVQLDGDLKVGNFTYTVNEFTIPLAGLPISINRTYDSRRKSELGDFGYGWNLDYNLVKTEKSRALGLGWQLNEYVTGPLGTLREYCVEPQGDILVNVTLPNDDVEQFKVKASPECNQNVPLLDVELVFEPVGDTQSTLALEESRQVRLVNGQLEVLGTNEVFDENDLVLTTREGYVYNFTANDDVTLITDPNGNTLTFSETGITHSSGKEIAFSRRSNGVISSIRRPDRQSYSYAYNSSFDLIRASAREGLFEDYTYNYVHGLLTINDSQGNRKVRNVYDDDGRLIAQEDNEGNRTSFTHDLAGRESVVTDRNGNITFYYYDERGNVTSMVDALNQVSTYTYDANDNQLTETDPLGNVTTRTFSANNDVLSVTDPEGSTVSYTYNVRGQEVTITDANGNQYINSYDGVGNLLSVLDPQSNLAGNNINARGLVELTQDMLGNQTTYTFDTDGNKLTQTDPLGVVTTFTYDDDNRVETETMQRRDGTGQLVTDVVDYDYDRNGRLIRSDDNLGLIESMGYDTLGNQTFEYDGLVSRNFEYDVYNRLTKTRHGDGSEETSTYDPEGNKLTDTDRNGNVTTYEYDALNRMVKTTHPDGSFIEVEYDAAGRVTREVDERGNATEYGYDKAGRRTSMTDAQGNEFTYVFDPQGNLTSETDALGRLTTYTYDELDRRTSMTLADTTQMSDAFDALGRNIGKTDQANKTTTYEYDPLGRLIKVTDALGQITQYQYDEAGNKVAQIDAEGRTTKWEYDQRGRVIARELPLGQRESFIYDLAGNVTSHTNFNGQTLTYTYNPQTGRLTSVTGSGINESYQYDAYGNRIVSQNYVGRYDYEYDTRHRLIKETQPDGTVLNYGYDEVGNKTTFTVEYKNGDTRTELYAYDSLNRLLSVTDNQAQTTTFEYDVVGNQTHIRYPNGLVSVSVFDELNRVTSITTLDAAENVLTSYVYGLDVTGRRASLTEHSGRISTFTYDDVYRLTNEAIVDPVNGDHTSAYIYDMVGNRTQSTVNGIATGFTYDNNDRLVSQGAFSYTYDEQGNMLTETDGITTKTYGYDANQRMISFNDGSQSATYQYNPDGIRVAKSVDTTDTFFLVDSNRDYAQVIAEQDSSDAIGKEYVFGSDLISQNTAADTHFYHYDSLGTTRNLSDSSAAITDSYFYEAFGVLLATDGSADNDYRYTGEQFDTELDNYYLRARYYDQNVGRFTQMDEWMGKACTPITLNKYIYGDADPINGIDPSGYFTVKSLMTGLNVVARGTTRSIGSSASFLIRGSKGQKTLTKGIGCKLGVAYLKRRFASESVHGHHSIPKNLGGDPKQALIYIPSTTHHMFHWVLHVMLKNDPALKGMGNWTSKDNWSEISRTKIGRKRLYNHIERASLVVDKFCKLKKPNSLAYFVRKNKTNYLGGLN